MRRIIPMALLGLALTAGPLGCGDDDDAPASAGSAAPGAPAAESDDPVERAVAIGKAIKADPERTEEILAERGMTIEELEALMYEIASDPEMSDDYQQAME